MRITAVVFQEVDRVAWQMIEMPPPAPDEVQIRTRFSTISAGTEGWVFRNRFTWAPTPYPCVPGYQRTGTIVTVGVAVIGWHVGDRVMATRGCWSGPVQPFWGSHLACGNTVATKLFAIPEGAVVAQVGYNAASRAVLEPGDWVVVYGDGLIGQCAAQAVRARGIRVILVGHRLERLDLGQAFSADAVVDSRHADVVTSVRQITGAEFITAVIDTIQTEEAQRQYMPLLQRGHGQIVYSGFTPGTTWADMGLLQQRELTAHFVSGWTRPRMEATLKLMAEGKLRLRPLISHLVPAWRGHEIYHMIRMKSEPFLGITLDWTEQEQCRF